MKKLILISGKKFVGKDTVADFLCEKGFEKCALADQLKSDLGIFISSILNIKGFWSADLWDTSKKESAINIKGNDYTLRQLMQWFGQVIKDKFGNFYWVNELVTIIKESELINCNLIVADCRFNYEIKELKNILVYDYDIITMRIKRDTNIIDTDISETHLDSVPDSEFDFVIENNGTKEELFNKIENILNYIK